MADPQDEFESAFAQAGAELAVKQGTATPTQAEQPPDDAAANPAPMVPANADDNSAPQGNDQVSADELKRQLDQAIHRERSSAARVSAFQKEKDRLLAELKVAQDAAAKAVQAPAPATPPPQARDDVLSNAPDLEQAVSLRINEAMEKANKAVAEANARAEAAISAAEELRASVDPLVNRRQEESRTETWKALDERFTGYDWRGDLKTSEFDAWLADAPDPVKQMFEKGQTVKESAAVLSLFYSATGKKPAAPAAANEARANPNQERLRQAAGIAPRGGQRQQPSGPAEDDFEGNFAAAAKALKQA